MNNSDMPAYPVSLLPGETFKGNPNGLTKREAFAMAAMQGLCANTEITVLDNEAIAEYAVKIADATLAELEK